MAADTRSKEIASGVLGLVALALGVVALLGIVRPGPDGITGDVAATAAVGVVVGVVGLVLGPTRGRGRRIASVGTGIALLALALFGGSLALDLLIEASG